MRGQRSITPVRNSPLRTEMAKEFSVAWTFLNSDSAFMAKGSNRLGHERVAKPFGKDRRYPSSTRRRAIKHRILCAA
jgi:hypothetical protein